jgi:hypothetical protein
LIDSESTYDGAFGGLTLTETVRYTASDTGVVVPLDAASLVAMQLAGTVPTTPQSRNAFWFAGSWSTTTVYDTFRCRGVSVVAVNRSIGAVDVAIRWGTRYVKDFQHNDVWLPVVGTFNADAQALRIFRTLDSCSAAPASIPGAGDIGGTPVDQAGVGVDFIVPGGNLWVVGLLDSLVAPIGTSWSVGTDLLGKLNTGAFLGFPAWSLLCTDYQTTHDVDEYHRLAMGFRWSSVLHCEQSSVVNGQGSLPLTSGASTTVRWVRGSNRSGSYSSLLSAFAAGRAEKGLYPV